jgi:hypothetical protein
MTFPKNFIWGAAVASYQNRSNTQGVEGFGLSVWDECCERKGFVKGRDTGDVAYDHDHRYGAEKAQQSSDGSNRVVRKDLIQMNRITAPLLLLLSLLATPHINAAESKLVKPLPGGGLEMLPWNEQGDRIPDFSYCGYRNGGVKLPDVPTLVTLEPSGAEDESARIQAALDNLGKDLEKTPDARGAILLKKGLWKVNKTLTMSYSGVVLRGEGDGEDGTVLLATGTWRFFSISIDSGRPGLGWPSQLITPLDQPYVPVGSTRFKIAKEDDAKYAKLPSKQSPIKDLKPGDGIVVRKSPNNEWIKDLGMDVYGWSGGKAAAFFERKLVSFSKGELVFDVPLPQSLDAKYGGGGVFQAPPDFRIRECGIENIRFDSTYDAAIRYTYMGYEHASDEVHCAFGLGVAKTENSWIRNCTTTHMQHGFVMLQEGARNITVQDCKNLDAVSKIAGGRRYSYCLAKGAGPSILIQRCTSRNGRHDFMTQDHVYGPNAFVDCSAESAWDASENHQRWTMGTLYDNVRVTGPRSGLISANRGRWGNGHGWSGTATVFWNCASPVIFALKPPLGQNFMIGCSDPKLYDPVSAKATISNQNNASKRNDQLVVGEALQGTAWKESPNEMVTPRSLYYAQLEARLGKAAVLNVTTEEQRVKPAQGRSVQ